MGRASENARLSKSWGRTSRDWTTRDHVARVDIVRPGQTEVDSFDNCLRIV